MKFYPRPAIVLNSPDSGALAQQPRAEKEAALASSPRLHGPICVPPRGCCDALSLRVGIGAQVSMALLERLLLLLTYSRAA